MGNSWECTQRDVPQDRSSDTTSKVNESWTEGSSSSSLQFCLRWNTYQTNLTKVFDQLLQSESFVDVTLACDGHSLKAHKVVLSACSPYFQTLFFENPCQHPIVIMRDVTWPQLKAIVEFMYKGEINVSQDQLAPLLMVAEMLKIRGLTEVNADQETVKSNEVSTIPSHDASLKREIYISGEEPSKNKRKRTSLSSTNSLNFDSNANTQNIDNSSIFMQPSIIKPKKLQNSSYVQLPVLPGTTFSSTTSYSTNVCVDDFDLKNNTIEHEDIPQKPLKLNHSITSASTSGNTDISVIPMKTNNKGLTWTQEQLQEAIHAVVTQRMRFTQASAAFGIPKGTLYDNILGKSKRMLVLDEAGLSNEEERTVLDYCCDVSISPYNRRTNRSLADVLEFVERLRRVRDPEFTFTGLAGFRWWWAFCKKHSIVSLYYDNKAFTNSTIVDSPA